MFIDFAINFDDASAYCQEFILQCSRHNSHFVIALGIVYNIGRIVNLIEVLDKSDKENTVTVCHMIVITEGLNHWHTLNDVLRSRLVEMIAEIEKIGANSFFLIVM